MAVQVRVVSVSVSVVAELLSSCFATLVGEFRRGVLTGVAMRATLGKRFPKTLFFRNILFGSIDKKRGRAGWGIGWDGIEGTQPGERIFSAGRYAPSHPSCCLTTGLCA